MMIRSFKILVVEVRVHRLRSSAITQPYFLPSFQSITGQSATRERCGSGPESRRRGRKVLFSRAPVSNIRYISPIIALLKPPSVNSLLIYAYHNAPFLLLLPRMLRYTGEISQVFPKNKLGIGSSAIKLNFAQKRPSTVTIEDNIDAMRLIIETDKRVTYQQVKTNTSTDLVPASYSSSGAFVDLNPVHALDAYSDSTLGFDFCPNSGFLSCSPFRFQYRLMSRLKFARKIGYNIMG
ncbi:hypothetical protein EVAR_49295_1 [Eumeta japonica]|uniref:Uncharacterized protein n=1 Tax=Eumeta variegata TaxID=151549 RepID=A0A4C1XQH9_EUMVA|nr:hypothetical protein EVAR_49295_1 [Eumeta japonica]